MNIAKKAAFAALAAGMLLLCSCDEAAPDISETKETEQTLDIGGNIYSPAVTLKLETPVIKYLGTGDIPAGSEDTYRATYAAQYYDAESGKYIFPDGSEELIISVVVAKNQLPDELTAAIQSDASPDLTDKLDNSYPYLMSRNIYEDLTAYMDMSAPQWVELREYVDRYEYNGRHFYYPWEYTLSPQMLFYNRGLFSEYDIPDPAQLYLDGEWTWESFLEDCRLFGQTGGGGLCGEYIADNFIASTGKMLIGRDENGKTVNNFADEDVVRAMEWLEINSELLCVESAESAAFCSAERDRADNDTLFAVPFPRDEQAEGYFCRAETFGYLVPKGAKNVAGACCFINCCRLEAEKSADTAETIEAETAEPVETLETREDTPPPPVIDLSGLIPVADENECFSEDVNLIIREMLDNARSGDAGAWREACGINSPAVNAAIDEINALF